MRDDSKRERKPEDRIDALIGAALRSYTEPPVVPEPRVVVAWVLERVRAAESSRRRWWFWGWAAATAVVLLIAIVSGLWVMQEPYATGIAWTPQPPRVVNPAVSRSTGSTRSFTSETRLQTSGSRARISNTSSVSTAALPKLDIFPTPRPLTPEEQALAAFVRHGPAEVQRAVLEDQQHWDDPIIVAGLQEQLLQAEKQQDQ